MYASCIKSQHTKSHMHTVTCKSTTIFCPYLLLSKLPLEITCFSLLVICLLACSLSWSLISSLAPLKLSKLKIDQRLSIVSNVPFYHWCMLSLPLIFLFSFIFQFIFSLISLACIFLTLHLPFLLFSFISYINLPCIAFFPFPISMLISIAINKPQMTPNVMFFPFIQLGIHVSWPWLIFAFSHGNITWGCYKPLPFGGTSSSLLYETYDQ